MKSLFSIIFYQSIKNRNLNYLKRFYSYQPTVGIKKIMGPTSYLMISSHDFIIFNKF